MARLPCCHGVLLIGCAVAHRPFLVLSCARDTLRTERHMQYKKTNKNGRPRNLPKTGGGFAPDLFKRFLFCPGPPLHSQSTDSGRPKHHVLKIKSGGGVLHGPKGRLLGTLTHHKPATSILGESPQRLRRWSGGRHNSQEAFLMGRKYDAHPDPQSAVETSLQQ